MADRFGIRNYSRNGDVVTFTVVALNADGTIDTGYVGEFSWALSSMTVSESGAFEASHHGQRTYTATIANGARYAVISAPFPGASTGASLLILESGFTASLSLRGDNILVGGPGNDNLTSSVGNDLFLYQRGGNDTAYGSPGDDSIYFGGAYTAADTVNGGDGFDSVGLQGDYSAGVTLGSLSGVELVALMRGNNTRFGDTAGNSYSYNITIDATTVVSDNKLAIQANSLRAGENFTLNASASDIDLLVYAGLGNNVLTGGSGDDGFFFGDKRFGSGDRVDGGAGIDQVALQGNYWGSNYLTLAGNQLANVEFLVLLSASAPRYANAGITAAYYITLADGNVAAGETLIVSANTLQASETLRFWGDLETDGSFDVYSGAGDDMITGGAGADRIWGGAGGDIIAGLGGADILYGGNGADIFGYNAPSDTTAEARDTIMDFAAGDLIDLSVISTYSSMYGLDYIGGAAQTAAGQVQVIQSGASATVYIYLDGDTTADMAIDVNLVGGHSLSAGDFLL